MNRLIRCFISILIVLYVMIGIGELAFWAGMNLSGLGLFGFNVIVCLFLAMFATIAFSKTSDK